MRHHRWGSQRNEPLVSSGKSACFPEKENGGSARAQIGTTGKIDDHQRAHRDGGQHNATHSLFGS
jgi:hypothetical protein